MKFTHRYKLSYEADFPSGSDKDERLHHQIKQFILSFKGITSVRLEKDSRLRSSNEDEIYSILFASESFLVKNTFIYKNEVYLKDEVLKVESVDFSRNTIKTTSGKEIDLILFFENVEPLNNEIYYNNLKDIDMPKLSEAYSHYQEGFLDRLRARAMGAANVVSGVGREIQRRFSRSKKDPYSGRFGQGPNYETGYKGGVIQELLRTHSTNISGVLQDYFDELQRRYDIPRVTLERMPEWKRLENAVYNLINITQDFFYKRHFDYGKDYGTYLTSGTLTSGEEDRRRRVMKSRENLAKIRKAEKLSKSRSKSRRKTW